MGPQGEATLRVKPAKGVKLRVKVGGKTRKVRGGKITLRKRKGRKVRVVVTAEANGKKVTVKKTYERCR